VYRLVLDPIAEEQIGALPDEALHPLAELFALLEVAPWSGQPYSRANPTSGMMAHVFGERGMATYLVLEDQHVVCLVRVEWP
jgi:hypothetical protein